MADQLQALNVIDFAVLSASSAAAVTFADGTPALRLSDATVGGKQVRRVFLQCATGNLCYRTDGTTCSSAAGSSHVLIKDGTLSFTGANYKSLIKNFSCIGAGSTVPVTITYFD
jgi:hypothetical protein